MARYFGQLKQFETSDGRVVDVEFEYVIEPPDPAVGIPGGVNDIEPVSVIEFGEFGDDGGIIDIDVEPDDFESSLSPADRQRFNDEMRKAAQKAAAADADAYAVARAEAQYEMKTAKKIIEAVGKKV